MNDYDDFDDEFDDDFGDDGNEFMNDDFMEDSFDDVEPEDVANDDSGIESEQSDEICEDEFTANEALMFGVGMGFAYEEGLENGRSKRLQREFDKENDDKSLDDENIL